MTDLFEAAARRAQKDKGKMLFKDAPITMENNALVELIKEKQRELIESESLKRKWAEHIESTIGQAAALCGTLGRRPKNVRYDGAIIWIELRGEAVRLPVGEIRDPKDLAVACQKLIGSVMMI